MPGLFVWTFFGVVAAIQFYLAAGETISVWVASEYEPLFRAGFNLVVALGCGLGLSGLVWRYRTDA